MRGDRFGGGAAIPRQQRDVRDAEVVEHRQGVGRFGANAVASQGPKSVPAWPGPPANTNSGSGAGRAVVAGTTAAVTAIVRSLGSALSSGTSISTQWRYGTRPAAYGTLWLAVRRQLLLLQLLLRFRPYQLRMRTHPMPMPEPPQPVVAVVDSVVVAEEAS